MADDREITAGELAGIVSDGMGDADVTRARGLSTLLDFRLARLDGLRRELDLRRAVDDADPRLTLLQERLAATELTARALDLEALRAVTPAPPAPAADEATIGGRVVLLAGDVPDDAQVRLRDKGGNLVRGVQGRLDPGGAFTLNVPVSDGGTDPAPEYTVVVLDSKGNELARDDQIVAPAKGAIEYRELPLKSVRVGAMDPAVASPVAPAVTPATPVVTPVVSPATPLRPSRPIRPTRGGGGATPSGAVGAEPIRAAIPASGAGGATASATTRGRRATKTPTRSAGGATTPKLEADRLAATPKPSGAKPETPGVADAKPSGAKPADAKVSAAMGSGAKPAPPKAKGRSTSSRKPGTASTTATRRRRSSPG